MGTSVHTYLSQFPLWGVNSSQGRCLEINVEEDRCVRCCFEVSGLLAFPFPLPLGLLEEITFLAPIASDPLGAAAVVWVGSVVAGKVSSLSKKPEKALENGKGDVWEQEFRHSCLPCTSSLCNLPTNVVGRCKRWRPGKLSSNWGHNTVLRTRMLSKELHLWETLQFSIDCYLSSQRLSQSLGRFAEIKASWTVSVK